MPAPARINGAHTNLPLALSTAHTARDARAAVTLSVGDANSALGLGISFVPDITVAMPPFFRDMFSSGIATGALCALCLNSLLPGTRA